MIFFGIFVFQMISHQEIQAAPVPNMEAIPSTTQPLLKQGDQPAAVDNGPQKSDQGDKSHSETHGGALGLSKTAELWSAICGGLLVVIICLIILLVVLVRQKRKKIPGYAPLHKTLDDTSNTLTLAELKHSAAEIIGSQEAADQIVSMLYIESNELMDVESGDVQQMTTPVRYQNIKLRTSTQVVIKKQASKKGPQQGCGLHMTKLRDYYGDAIILCQAPLPEQFQNQWQAIWQERIGLVVWIGNFEEDGQKKLDPYVPIVERQKITVKNFVITTIAIIKRPYEYDQYLVRVQKTKKKTQRIRTRELIFVHAHLWPDHSAPIVPAKLVDFIDRINTHHENLINKKMPGVMFHCSAGLQRSPALVAVYIGRQIWKENRRVNVIGILRYIRKLRYKAFGIGNAALQIQIVFGLVQIIATRFEFNVKCKVTKKRRRPVDMFDERVRRSSWSGDKSGSSSTSNTPDSGD